MPTENRQLLKLLKDIRVLRLAYAASSDYVMRLSFGEIRELRAFRGKTGLAPDILKQYLALLGKVHDSVILGAHLYAIELTGAQDRVLRALVATLGHKELRADPRLAQTAGKMGARLLGRRLPAGKDLNEQELAEIHRTLKKEVIP